MRRTMATIAAVCCLMIVFTFSGCSMGLERDYYEDIHIQVETHPGEIIIREWRFLLGSGAEVYYKLGDIQILLGQLLGGNNGYCPFQNGQYSVTVEANEITIEWCRYPNSAANPWDNKVFELPFN